jgi:hypothetical protein
MWWLNVSIELRWTGSDVYNQLFPCLEEWFTFWKIGAESNACYVCIDRTKVRVYHQIKTLSRSLVRFRYLDERHADNGCRSTGTPQQSGRPEATPLWIANDASSNTILNHTNNRCVNNRCVMNNQSDDNLIVKFTKQNPHSGCCPLHTVGLGELCWAEQAEAHLRCTCRSGIPHVGMDLGTSYSLLVSYIRTTYPH